MLYIDGLSPGYAALLGWLLEILACTKLTDSSGLLELPLEFLESPFDVLSFLYWYDNNFFKSPPFLFSGAKIVNNFYYPIPFSRLTKSATPSEATLRMWVILRSGSRRGAGSTIYIGVSAEA